MIVSAIDAPADGSTVAGDTIVMISASDNVAVTRVELYLDDTLLGTDTTAPYSIGWDTANGPDGNYTLRARAYDAAGNIGTSLIITLLVSNNPADSEPPTAPTGLSAKVKGKQVTLSWQAATDNVGVTGYAVWRDSARIGDATQTGFDDNSVTPGTAHTYTLTAYDAAGNISSPGNPVTVTIPGGGKGTKSKTK